MRDGANKVKIFTAILITESTEITEQTEYTPNLRISMGLSTPLTRRLSENRKPAAGKLILARFLHNYR